MAAPARPFKLWSNDRNVKKSVTVVSLQDLLEKARTKLNIQPIESIKVVLEEDGTEIDDEDYFAFVPSNSTIVILRGSETWHHADAGLSGQDETDYGSGLSERTKQLIIGLQKDLSRIIAFSNDDLEQIVSTSLSDLSQLLKETESYAKALQDACQRHLDERHVTSEAIDLLRLYHQSRKNSPFVEDDSKKRKLENT
ncbi:hypothetical protein SNE40_013993 [Patella caerulea]|uniref:CIDE-N domain-containing protein n=1 Tax=Patella caerulea TaxID=87958 RepID=A0AAN8JHE7_PATCE